jgi:hypothetical protein
MTWCNVGPKDSVLAGFITLQYIPSCAELVLVRAVTHCYCGALNNGTREEGSVAGAIERTNGPFIVLSDVIENSHRLWNTVTGWRAAVTPYEGWLFRYCGSFSVVWKYGKRLSGIVFGGAETSAMCSWDVDLVLVARKAVEDSVLGR